MGWKSLIVPAVRTEAGGSSGGVGLFVRDIFGLGPPNNEVGSHEVVKGRAIIGIADFPGYPPLALASAYLVVGQKMSEENIAIMTKLAIAASATQRLVLYGADWNNSWEVVASTNFAEMGGYELRCRQRQHARVRRKDPSLTFF